MSYPGGYPHPHGFPYDIRTAVMRADAVGWRDGGPRTEWVTILRVPKDLGLAVTHLLDVAVAICHEPPDPGVAAAVRLGWDGRLEEPPPGPEPTKWGVTPGWIVGHGSGQAR
jgi:hypothetical protein